MKQKQRMIVTAAMAATLATGALPTTSAFAAETKSPIQQQESQMGIQPFAQSNLEKQLKLPYMVRKSKKLKYLSMNLM